MSKSIHSGFHDFPNEFILFDTEFTAWEGSEENHWSKPNEFPELVQIGALKIKKTKSKLKIVDSLSVFILPKLNPKLSRFFIELTQITQESIDKHGVDSKDGINQLYAFSQNKKGDLLTLYSYGNDYNIIHYNLVLHKIIETKLYQWQSYFKDIRPFFNQATDTSQYRCGTLYRAFNITPTETPEVHNALWDSKSLYLSLNHLLFTKK